MLFGNRGPRSSGTRTRKSAAFRPREESLEAKILMAVDLGGAQFGALPNVATAPFGVLEAGTNASQGAGWRVTNLNSINATGFDSFLIGGPSVSLQTTSLGNEVAPVAGTNSQAYLLFGSQSVSSGSVDWLGINAAQRVGELQTLGSTPQNNPITGTTGYDFAGVQFITSQQRNSELGASGAFVGLINGSPAFLIGAPNATGFSSTNTGYGRVYLVYGPGLTQNGGPGGNNLPVDLDLPGQYSNITIVTFATSVAGSRLGTSIAGLGNFLNTNTNALAMGAPGATVANLPGSGAIYVLASSVLATFANGALVDSSLIGQSGGITGLTFGGGSSGDQAGFSVASAGNVNGASNGVSGIDDLLIGAPRRGTSAGTAYLIYGGNLTQFTRTVTVNNASFTYIPLNTVGGQVTVASAPAAVFTGASGDFTGYSVSSAGDFNADGLADVMIGAPGTSSSAGAVYIVYGQRITSNGTSPVSGSISLTSPPATQFVETLTGATAGDMAGYSVSEVGRINSDAANEVIIGAPGATSSQGTAYLLPGRTGTIPFTGTYSLSSAEAAPLFGIQFFLTTPGAGSSSPAFFGSSVSGRLIQSGQTRTADGDVIGDFIVGAPGYPVNSSSGLAGAGVVVQGAALTLTVPPANTGIVTTIVQIDTSTTSPFAVNATTPNNMDIYVTSVTTGGTTFNPFRDIDPTTVVVNGVAFPTATIRQDPNNAANAIITISPRSSLGLNPTVTSLTIFGRTLSTSPLANQTWTAQAAIAVTGGVTPPSGGVVAVLPPIGLVTPTTLVSPLGTNFVPTVSSLSALNYAPIPLKVAIDQYLPPPGFRQRIYAWNRGGKAQISRGQFQSKRRNGPSGVWTLGSRVFTRGRFHPGKSYSWTHADLHGNTPGRLVPQQALRQRYTSRPISGKV